MLIRDTKGIYRMKVEASVGKDATAKDVLDHLLGDYDGCSSVDFVIREWTGDDTSKPLHRINMLWAIPLTIVCTPYQYVAKGYSGWDTKTVFGRWILRVTGHLKEV